MSGNECNYKSHIRSKRGLGMAQVNQSAT